MSSLFSSLQSSLTDTIRFAVLHKITTGGISNVSFNNIALAGVIFVCCFIPGVISEYSWEWTKIYDMVKSFFVRKYTVRLKGKTVTCIPAFHHKPSVHTIYSNDFKAIWSDIIQHIKTNKTIYEIREIKNIIKLRNNIESPEKDHGLYIVSQKERFTLDESLGIYGYATEQSVNLDEKTAANSESYEIHIYSFKSNVAVLKQYIEDRTRKYLDGLAETRHNKQFMYTLINNKYVERNEQLECWRENEFSSSKTFRNIFFENKTQVIDKIDFFLNNREWYAEHGLPYTLGIGLYGPPGTGKTSFIKALTNYTKTRHLINMPMALIRTKKQLSDFYFEDQYNDLNLPNSVGFMCKIIVIEDIDCAGDIVLERSRNSSTQSSIDGGDAQSRNLDVNEITLNDKINQMDEGIKETIRENILDASRKMLTKMATPEEERITLDDILNLWDGIRETPGRILVISSNHYDKLDTALRRPGRIDITLGFKRVTHDVLREMYMHFYKTPIDETQLVNITPELYTPAEIANLYMLFRNDQNGFMKRLCENVNLEY